jgi:phosphodiesterase/alkaline phosphatase D-like protein
MNSLIIADILNNYNHKPYYNTDNSDNYISINDDRIGRIVSFKLYEKDDEIFADFNEANKIQPLNTKKHKTKVITSLEDFKNKWTEYYNYNS